MFLLIYLFLYFIYLFRDSGGGAERAKEREKECQTGPTLFSAEPDAGFELTNHKIVT